MRSPRNKDRTSTLRTFSVSDMKTLEELKQFFNNVLMPELVVLEGQRKKALTKIIIACAIVVPIFVSLTVLIRHPFPLIIGVFICVGFGYFFTREYVSNFKTGVIEKIVKYIDENLAYSKFGYVNEALFKASLIFRQRIDDYDGDDHVQGILGKTRIQFSEVHAKNESRDSKGRRRDHTIFKGLFFMGDFNKEFKSMTVVLPDKAEKMFGHIGTAFQSWNKGRGELIKMEDPEFEKLFVVYGNDQIEARYILSTSLMRRITDFQKKTKKNIYLSFVGTKIFIAIPYSKELFEPRVFRSVLDFTPIQEYYEDLTMFVGIVDDLNLNTRIWSKQ